jgi:hypothetical protein
LVLLTSVSPAAACRAACFAVEAEGQADGRHPPDTSAISPAAACLADYMRALAVEVPALDFDVAPPPTPAPPPTAAPTGVADARRRPDWEGPDGWRVSVTAEFDKVCNKHHALCVVRKSEYRDAVHDYGADRVSLAFLLIVFKLKTDPAGVALPGILGKKSRIAISDPNSPRSLPTYAPCADEATGNAVDTIVQALGMKSVTLDAQAAYFHGKRPTMDEGGRLIFAPIPPYAHLFIPGCPGPDDPDFHQYYFRIDGNMPGLAEAGRIWNTHLVRWLVNDTDMTQSIVDPCIFSRVNDGGRDIIIIRVTSTTAVFTTPSSSR